MKDGFYIRKGWLGTERNGFQILYNTADKEFAVFKNRENIEQTFDSVLKTVNVAPTPDFICEANAAAITLTTECNMNCRYCYVKPTKSKDAMTTETVRDAIRALGEQTDKELVVFAWGGEPTQNPEALTAMLYEALNYPHIKISLVTNGVIESEFLDKLLVFKNLVFQMSFDGLKNQNLQKPLRTKSNSLVRLLDSLETVSLVSKRLALRATVTRDNIEELNDCLLRTVGQYTNRLMIEHLHTYNGRAVKMKNYLPDIEDYVNLVFSIIPKAEENGIHVKILPLDHLRAGGPNDKMNFLNILPDRNIVVSNAVIYSKHHDFNKLNIGKLINRQLVFDELKNKILIDNYLHNHQVQCSDCFANVICHGSVQRYLFITNSDLEKWDDSRCKFFIAVFKRWLEEMYGYIIENVSITNDCLIKLIAPEGKIHYPMFVMKNGLTLKTENLC
jgi:sulfatase maturation enzyme AslB (radical SAM superfamily)